MLIEAVSSYWGTQATMSRCIKIGSSRCEVVGNRLTSTVTTMSSDRTYSVLVMTMLVRTTRHLLHLDGEHPDKLGSPHAVHLPCWHPVHSTMAPVLSNMAAYSFIIGSIFSFS